MEKRHFVSRMVDMTWDGEATTTRSAITLVRVVKDTGHLFLQIQRVTTRGAIQSRFVQYDSSVKMLKQPDPVPSDAPEVPIELVDEAPVVDAPSADCVDNGMQVS